MDVWVACFGWELNGGLYWGFAQGTRAETLEALDTNATVRHVNRHPHDSVGRDCLRLPLRIHSSSAGFKQVVLLTQRCKVGGVP